MEQANGVARPQLEEYAGDDNREEYDYEERPWPSAAIEVTITPQQRRIRFLAEFAHADVAPGGIEHMSPDQFEHTFGKAAAQRYEENRRQRRSTAFDFRAYEFLKLVRHSRETATLIGHHLRQISRATGQQPEEGLIESWRRFPENHTVGQFDSLRTRTEAYLQDIEARLQNESLVFAKGNAQVTRGDVKKAHGLFKAFPISEMHERLEESNDGAGVDDDFGRDAGSPERSPTRQGIIDIEARSNRQMLALDAEQMAGDELDRAKLCIKLDNLKAHAELGVFCADDLLRIAIGEPTFAEESGFVEGLLKKMKKSIAENKSKSGKSYHAFYLEFEKMLPDLVATTLGQTLFAFDNLKAIHDWTVEDMMRLKQFTESRYQTLQDVFDGLADKERNSLSTLKNMNLRGLAHEVLRSTLYPNYQLEIRVGLGGTTQEDPLLRACAYILPPLDFMQAFYDANEKTKSSGPGIAVPQLVIFDGSALAVEVNGLDAEAARQNGWNYLSLLEKFVGHFFPALAPHVTLDQVERRDVFDNELYPRLREAARELLNNGDPDIGQVCHLLAKQAKCHDHNSTEGSDGSDTIYRENALRYAAAHLMPTVFKTLSRGRASPVIKWGGQGEAAFDRLQRRILQYLYVAPAVPADISIPHAVGLDVDALCTNGPIGVKPPYYRLDSPAEFGVSEAKNAMGEFPDQWAATLTSLMGRDDASKDMRALFAHREVKCGGNFARFIQQCAL